MGAGVKEVTRNNTERGGDGKAEQTSKHGHLML